MTPAHLFNPDTGEELTFKSLKQAADHIGVAYISIYQAIKRGRKCKGYIVTTVGYEMMEYDVPREELDIPHYARIEGKEFVAVKCPNKTNCTECDIYKLDPPKSMVQSPLCYEYNCGTHKIVDICSRYKCIWKRKRRGTSSK